MSNSRYGSTEQAGITLPVFQYISRSKFEHDWQSTLHSHPFTEFAFIESGEGSVIIEDRTYPVTSGELVVILPNCKHTELSSADNALGYYFLGVKNIQFDAGRPAGESKPLVPEYGVRPQELAQGTPSGQFGVKSAGAERLAPVLPLGSQSIKIRNLFSDIFHEVQVKQKGYELQVQSLLLQLSVFLIWRTEWLPSFTDPESASEGNSRTCAIIKDYIDNHYADKLSVEFLADKAGLSKYHFIREFSRYAGMPPVSYQLKRRVEESKYLLTSTELSIVDVAFSVGFSSTSHFSQRFKQIEGCAPLQYRKRSAAKLR
ncbi:AraC family transcriptional regulator [Treponema brennaborense]|uniref:Transcriptional regulator with cupin sensor, AraC family n=1 Tax=Treponema brennaborense (strain DSM 12168 / CIP 105900 / DD5/3) TaxID=906968 RepID=F4LM92_TREBD|nr:AraC family transcriptional regulator [Treponema brennaborense]AEE17758.1 transcriptional regulator with cupin sensor, AraC family [Treponema brennaborense DSM 12168]